MRRCVGCGRSAPKRELLRLALSGSAEGATAVLDRDGRMPGRGAYLCRSGEGELPAAECLSRALQRGAIQRTLRARAAVDAKLVESVGR